MLIRFTVSGDDLQYLFHTSLAANSIHLNGIRCTRDDATGRHTLLYEGGGRCVEETSAWQFVCCTAEHTAIAASVKLL